MERVFGESMLRVPVEGLCGVYLWMVSVKGVNGDSLWRTCGECQCRKSLESLCRRSPWRTLEDF